MRLKSGALAAALVAVLVIAGSVSTGIAQEAASEPDKGGTSRLGPYASLAVAYDWLTEYGNEDGQGETEGLNARAGYRFWRYLAAEVEYEWQAASPGGWTIGGNLKGYPTEGNLQPFAALGVMYWDIDGIDDQKSADDAAVRVGVGMDFYMSDHIYLNGGFDYAWGLGDIERNFATLYMGLGFRL